MPCHACRLPLHRSLGVERRSSALAQRHNKKIIYTTHCTHSIRSVCLCAHVSRSWACVRKRKKKNKKMFVCTSRSSEKPTLSWARFWWKSEKRLRKIPNGRMRVDVYVSMCASAIVCWPYEHVFATFRFVGANLSLTNAEVHGPGNCTQ